MLGSSAKPLNGCQCARLVHAATVAAWIASMRRCDMAGQPVGEGDDRRGVAGQDVPTTACGRLIVGRVTHER